MPAERTAMHHVREVLRLKFVGGVPTREIARRIGVAASTVRTTIKRFQAAGLSWSLPEERYSRRSTIITSQIPIDKWHELIGDPTYDDAILDRIVHNAHRINLTGHSLRRLRLSKPSKD